MTHRLLRFVQVSVIALLALVVVSNVSGALRADPLVQQDSIIVAPNTYTSIYLTSSLNDSDNFFPSAEALAAGVQVRVSTEEVLTELLALPGVKILYLDPAALDDLDTAWLRQALSRNYVLVAIDTQLSDLSARTQVPVEGFTDLRPREGQFMASIIADIALDDPPYNTKAQWHQTYHYNNLRELDESVTGLLHINLTQQEGDK